MIYFLAQNMHSLKLFAKKHGQQQGIASNKDFGD